MNEILIFCTVDSLELGEQIAETLVETREAACVNIISNVRSVYRWKSKLCHDAELLLVIKSITQKFEVVRETIRKMHSYQVPEVIAVPIYAGDADYLEWLRTSLGDPCTQDTAENRKNRE